MCVCVCVGLNEAGLFTLTPIHIEDLGAFFIQPEKPSFSLETLERRAGLLSHDTLPGEECLQAMNGCGLFQAGIKTTETFFERVFVVVKVGVYMCVRFSQKRNVKNNECSK